MWIILKSQEQQAVLMAIEEFNDKQNKSKDSVGLKDFSQKNGCFSIVIESQLEKDFLSFVQKNYSKFFKTKVVFNEVSGFKTQASLIKAIELFNKVNLDYYIDPCVEIREVVCKGKNLYLPDIDDPLFTSFWNFVKNRKSLEQSITVGREKC